MANLKESAMLVHQRTRQFTGAKSDARIRGAAVDKHNVKASAIRGGQKLLVTDRGAELLGKVSTLYGQANREVHLARTLPWMDSGPRVLASVGYLDYMAATRAVKDRIDIALADFYPWYEDEWRQGFPQARADLNGLFVASDYPSPAELRRRFVLDVDVLPFPDADDFRVDLGAAELARVRRQIEASVETALAAAMGDVWERIRAVMGHLAERLRAYDPSGDKVVGKFHDTLLLNVRELVDLLPGLNVTADPNVAEIGRCMAAVLVELPAAGDVAGKDAAVARLREDEAMRRKVAVEAEAILSKMADFV